MFHLGNVGRDYFLTSESVSRGHPDKVADRISDEVLDHFLTQNPYAHVAVETLVTRDNVVVVGEVCGVSVNPSDIDSVVRSTVRDIGYSIPGFHWNSINVLVLIHEQSPDIILGVNTGRGKTGAGDQGVMYGYAIDETDSLIPAPIFYSHLVLKNIASAIDTGKISGLGPDAKTEITLLYVDGRPVKVLRAVLSIQHDEGMTQQDVRQLVYPYFVAAIPRGWMCKDEDFLVNPTGRFVIGGPVGDSGMTGRKIMVDTYGGHIPHGGGAFSGKDPSKVDRSAAYMARYLAKNVVYAGLATECLVQMSYAIGVPDPLTFSVNTLGTGTIPDEQIEKYLTENIDLSVSGICEHLSLFKQIYSPTSYYGHFGRSPGDSFSWERLDLSLNMARVFGLRCVECV
ncbi:methionine adenosyltransferase [Anaplasma capra]|uniref:methionine adenosyltransferase n=1 Tax=Anaplasma capra TaxID=1562740 RepID=UPI0021D60F83|nr:methionine adenosyltransferase [Anaplasma capra]MCU7612315.1 methionine adenosyltransferase [Anaplasma capra]